MAEEAAQSLEREGVGSERLSLRVGIHMYGQGRRRQEVRGRQRARGRQRDKEMMLLLGKMLLGLFPSSLLLSSTHATATSNVLGLLPGGWRWALQQPVRREEGVRGKQWDREM
jgi:hypothetical protein